MSSEAERRMVAIHEAGHGVVALSLGIVIKKITIKPTSESGFSGHVEFDQEAVQTRYLLVRDDKDKSGKFLSDLAMVGLAGEAVDLIINRLPTDQAAARSAKDLDAFRWFCENVWKISRADQNAYIAQAKEIAVKNLQSEAAIRAVNHIADRLMREETIAGVDLPKGIGGK